MTDLYVYWQAPEARRWYPVGVLSHSGSRYRFAYTVGAEKAKSSGFNLFGRMDDIHRAYESEGLFPIFANRILARSRPEYGQFLHWIGLDGEADDPLILLDRTGGSRATDSLQLYRKPEPNENGKFELAFFSHGISHLPTEAISVVDSLQIGASLYPLLDNLNQFDSDAVALRTDDPAWIVGYVPRFFALDVRECIAKAPPESVSFDVLRVNPDAPLQMRLLCRFWSDWPEHFAPCSGSEYQILEPTEERRVAG